VHRSTNRNTFYYAPLVRDGGFKPEDKRLSYFGLDAAKLQRGRIDSTGMPGIRISSSTRGVAGPR